MEDNSTDIEKTGPADLSEENRQEDDWLRAAARNPAFQCLAASTEDIYSLEDGEPFLDQG